MRGTVWLKADGSAGTAFLQGFGNVVKALHRSAIAVR
jgi:hypothetical protein